MFRYHSYFLNDFDVAIAPEWPRQYYELLVVSFLSRMLPLRLVLVSVLLIPSPFPAPYLFMPIEGMLLFFFHVMTALGVFRTQIAREGVLLGNHYAFS